MNIKVICGDITVQDVGAVVAGVFQDVSVPTGIVRTIDERLEGTISKLMAQGEITGKRGDFTLIHTLGKMVPERILVVGLGKEKDLNAEFVRIVSAETCRYLQGLPVTKVATVAYRVGSGDVDRKIAGRSIAEGSILGLYKFSKYKTEKEVRIPIEELIVVEDDSSEISALSDGVKEGVVLGEAVVLCRDLVNEPANFMTPSRLATVASEVAKSGELEVEIFERDQIAEMGMGAFLGVAQGSKQPPKLIVLRYKGDLKDDSNSIGLLGKGITFDSGGISLKPALNMGEMKTDMAGGAAVISAMQAISRFKPKINVTAVIPATENMPGSGAQRPGDIVKTMNGKTIEIDNTDAEGRLVLADAVSYARSLGLNKLVDVATLTGAIITALGKSYTGLFGNDQDLIDQVIAAGYQTGERMWQLPVLDDYKDQYRSSVSDMKNTGGRNAGSIIGAQIIGEFVGDESWVHLDIAGTARSDGSKGYSTEGATGVPVRTLIQLVLNTARDGF